MSQLSPLYLLDTNILVHLVRGDAVWGRVRATYQPLLYSVIDAHRQRIGQPLGKNDVWIAATASVAGARLLTTDKDFDQLDPVFLTRDWIDPAGDSV